MMFRVFLNNIGICKEKLKDEKYPTARPSNDDYDTAKQIVGKIDMSNCTLQSSEFVEVIAYLVKYAIVECKNNTKYISECSRCFATAPWMAKKNHYYFEPYIECLIQKDVLEYDKDAKILFIKDSAKSYLKTELREVENSFEVIKDYIYKFVDKDKCIILKLAVFHGQTFMDFMDQSGQPLVNLLREYPNLFIKVLCVGEYSGEVAVEDADEKHLKVAISEGMIRLYELADIYKKRLEIRIVRDNIVDISIRTTILIEDNRIAFCHFLHWRHGYERGIHGNTYAVSSKSSLALQINKLYEDAFSRAIPAKRNLSMIIYQAKRLGKLGILFLMAFALNILCFNFNKFLNGQLSAPEILEIITTIFGTMVLEKVIDFIGKKVL